MLGVLSACFQLLSLSSSINPKTELANLLKSTCSPMLTNITNWQIPMFSKFFAKTSFVLHPAASDRLFILRVWAFFFHLLLRGASAGQSQTVLRLSIFWLQKYSKIQDHQNLKWSNPFISPSSVPLLWNMMFNSIARGEEHAMRSCSASARIYEKKWENHWRALWLLWLLLTLSPGVLHHAYEVQIFTLPP